VLVDVGMRRRSLVAVAAAAALAAACGDGGAVTPDGASPGGADASLPVVDAGTPDAALPPWGGPGADPRVWRPRVIYLVFPDRFQNGNPGNDDVGHPDCHDPAAPTLFHGGDLAGLRGRIAYLEELGVSALWVTPLTAQVPRRNSCGYHGYWADLALPADALDASLEPRLGTPAELDALLADLHGAGIAAILDVVVNHPGRGARIVTQSPSWFHPIEGCEQLGPADHMCSLNGLPDFAQEKPEVAAYVTATTTAWLERYAFDGVRMDTAKHVPLAYFEGSWMPAARAARAFPFVVAEVFSDGDMAQFVPYFEAGFDSVFHFPLRRALVNAIARGGSMNEVADVVADTLHDLGLERALMVSTFLDNHDVPRFMEEAGGIADAERVRRYRLALVALFTLPGIPQLYYGDELGALGAFPENRRDMPAWAFDAATRAGARPGYFGDPAETFALTKMLIALRGAHPALHEGYYSEIWRPNGGKNLFAFYRAAAGGDRVLVVIDNGTGPSGDIDLPFAQNPGITPADRAAWPDGTVLVDVLGHGAPATLTVQGGKIKVNMPAKTAGVYVVAP
jgi:glycosidase